MRSQATLTGLGSDSAPVNDVWPPLGRSFRDPGAVWRAMIRRSLQSAREGRRPAPGVLSGTGGSGWGGSVGDGGGRQWGGGKMVVVAFAGGMQVFQ